MENILMSFIAAVNILCFLEINYVSCKYIYVVAGISIYQGVFSSSTKFLQIYKDLVAHIWNSLEC